MFLGKWTMRWCYFQVVFMRNKKVVVRTFRCWKLYEIYRDCSCTRIGENQSRFRDYTYTNMTNGDFRVAAAARQPRPADISITLPCDRYDSRSSVDLNSTFFATDHHDRMQMSCVVSCRRTTATLSHLNSYNSCNMYIVCSNLGKTG